MIAPSLRRKLFQKPLKAVVTSEPTIVSAENLGCRGARVVEATDRRFTVRGDGRIVALLLALVISGVGGGMLFPAWLLFVMAASDNYVPVWVMLGMGVASIALAPLGVYCIFHGVRGVFFTLFMRPESRRMVVTFDRQTGCVTLPPVYWGGFETVPFEKLYATTGGKPVLLLAIRSDGWPVPIGFGSWRAQDWAFYSWYMDADRPLPPGTAFDPYRERDEARRRGLRTKEFRHAAEGIGNVMPLEGPVPEEVNLLLQHFEEVFAQFPQIEWAAFGGLVHHLTEHVDGFHLEVKTTSDEPLPKDRSDELNQSLMNTLLSGLPQYRFLELAFTPRPRGRMIYSKAMHAADRKR